MTSHRLVTWSHHRVSQHFFGHFLPRERFPVSVSPLVFALSGQDIRPLFQFHWNLCFILYSYPAITEGVSELGLNRVTDISQFLTKSWWHCSSSFALFIFSLLFQVGKVWTQTFTCFFFSSFLVFVSPSGSLASASCLHLRIIILNFKTDKSYKNQLFWLTWNISER